MCSTKDIGELFEGRPDTLVLAFDAILQATIDWQPNTIGASIHSVVMTSKKAWLIIKPMKKCLDVKFYYDELLTSHRVHKTTKYPNKWAHHLRIHHEDEVDQEIIELLQTGYKYSVS